MDSLQCVLANDFSNLTLLKMLIHILHKGMVSNQCVFKCVLSNGTQPNNADPHTSQKNCFSPVCVPMCNFRVDPTENADSQTSHEHGFSPECFL